MRRLFIVLLSLLIVGALPVSAQVAQQVPAKPDSSAVLHITDELTRRPATQQALRRFRQLKRQNQLPARRQITRSEVGDTRTFSVYNQTTEDYDEIEFTLRVIEGRFLLWVETAELDNDHVRPQDIDALVQALAEETPPGSINPDEGVIVNDEEVFGTPPDVDGNGKSDVLLLDIRDDYEGPGDGFIAGFVNGADLGSDPGNERDILYLDTKPGIYVPSSDRYRAKDFLAKTAAHEYQHLIHLNYDLNETAFVNEGLSEWAEVVNGYTPRTISYLSDPERYNQWLLNWDDDDPFDDYQRAGLFTNYIAERIGTPETGSITRQKENGVAGYQAVLDQRDIAFEDLLLDFHTANFLNDSGIETRFGYETPVRQGILAEPTEEYDGWETTETPETQKTVAAGAALYLVWENVQNFNLRLNAASGAAGNLRLRILAERSDGSVTVNDYPLQAGIRSFPGTYERLVAVVANVEASQQASSVDITYSASWTQEQAFEAIPIVYDDGQAVSGLFFSLSAAQNGAFANRFILPNPDQGTRLDKVFLAPYFDNQFSNSTLPREAPRNLRLVIWDSQNGQPGEELFSRHVEDPRAFQPATLALNFFEVDLADEPIVTSLPDTIFVGYTEAGSDENYITTAVSEYRADTPYADRNMSFIGNLSSGSWLRLWDVELESSGGETIQVGERVLPIRAEFATPQPAGPPPVRLVEGSFAAEPNDESVALSWQTSEEREGSFFAVQRSLDGGSTFMAIDTLQGQGAGSGEQYTYEDNSIPFGVDTLHYRLKFADQSGSFGYSQTLQAVLPPPQQITLHGNFPNPFRQETTIRYELTRRQHVTLAVFDMLGRKVAVLADEVQEGDVETMFQADGLSSGVYVYVLETEDRTVTRRMVLLQ